jgi:hypothetical protein
VNATLIDLHVRSESAAETPLNIADWTRRAKEAGLDGIAVIGNDKAPEWSGSPEGAVVYAGVEVDTDVGRLLCYPREVDEWFTGGGWQATEKANGGGPEVYVGKALVSAFAERGGVVIVAQPFDRDLDHPCGEGAFQEQTGLAAVVVTSSPRHTTSNERAAAAASAAKLPGVGGSASHPEGGRFGAVATLLMRPAPDQKALVEVLKAGRVWPVEIASPQPARSKPESKSDRKAEKQEARGRRTKKRGKSDDDRGNRIDLALTSHKPIDNHYDRSQPDVDPIAQLYGVDGRKAQRLDRYAHLSDSELDRLNGNRSRGNDTNVMPPPDFRVMRAERQHVNLLLRTIERNDRDDSIALRFAFKALSNASPEALAEVEERHERDARQTAQRRRRRRRRK